MERESYRVRDESIKRSKLFEQISNIESHISYPKPDRISGVFNARPQAACGHNLSTTKVICMRLWPLCALPSSRVCSVLPCICNFLHGRVDHHHQQPLTYCNGKATCPTIPPLVQHRVSTSDRRGRPGGGQVRKTPRDMLGLSIKRNCWSAGSIINKLNANHSKDSLTKW